MGRVWGRFLYARTCPCYPNLPHLRNGFFFLQHPPLVIAGPIPSCHFRANLKAPKLNPKMNKNNYSISFIFFYMANKIILNKFLTHLNNVMSTFKFKKIDKNYFLILKEKRKENLNKKKNHIPPKIKIINPKKINNIRT